MRPLASLLLALTGCGLAAPVTGEVIEPGVARVRWEARLHGTDVVDVTLIFPSDDQGGHLTNPKPGVVFIQGGFVPTARYEWQARALARNGYMVAMPEHPLGLAFFAMDTGDAAKQVLTSQKYIDVDQLVVMGHSLGSVVATKLALRGGYRAAVLEAGYPDSADTAALPSLGIPTLSLAGAADCSSTLGRVQEGWATLPTPSALVVLDGVTHYQFTDSQKEDDDRGCAPTTTIDDAHARMEAALVGFLSSALADAAVGETSLRAVVGATVETK